MFPSIAAWGTDYRRKRSRDDYWLRQWLYGWQHGLGGLHVVPDVRFANEAEAIRELGGVIVRVERPGVGPLSAHVSEVPPAEPDFIIRNNGTIRDLQSQAATWPTHAA